MSRTQDSWEDASPFAWIFGAALAFVALGGVARAVRGRRASSSGAAPRPTARSARSAPSTRTVGGADDAEDGALAGHPS